MLRKHRPLPGSSVLITQTMGVRDSVWMVKKLGTTYRGLTTDREISTLGPIAVDANRAAILMASQDGHAYAWGLNTKQRIAVSPARCMKTTLEIPDPIFRRAKSAAAERGIPLREFVTEAVRDKLAAPAMAAEKPWMKHFGKLKHLHKETVRINRLIEEDSERIDPEMWNDSGH